MRIVHLYYLPRSFCAPKGEHDDEDMTGRITSTTTYLTITSHLRPVHDDRRRDDYGTKEKDDQSREEKRAREHMNEPNELPTAIA